MHICKSLHKDDAQRLNIKPKNEAIIVRDACDKSFLCVVSPAVRHLTRSNCYNCTLELGKRKGLSECKQTLGEQQNTRRSEITGSHVLTSA